jgi:hypothetical protein
MSMLDDNSPTPFASPSGISWNGHTGTVQYGKSDGQVVQFYNRSVLNKAKSLDHGRPYNEDVVYVRYFTPGEQRQQINDQPARPDDRLRWPMQWAQFSQNKAQTVEGTPISVLYPDHPSIEAQCRGAGVYTVEQLADLNATAIENVGMGCQTWVTFAKNYLEAANKGVNASTMRKELETRDSQIRVLEQKVELLMRTNAQLQANAMTGTVDQAQLQQMIAAAMARPAMPVGHDIPKAFDAQTAQINATHVTREVAETKRRRPKKTAAA